MNKEIKNLYLRYDKKAHNYLRDCTNVENKYKIFSMKEWLYAYITDGDILWICSDGRIFRLL